MDDEAAVELLTEALRIPSLTGRESALAEMLQSVMRDHGMDARIDDVGNVVGSIGSGARHAVILGHMDTVPGEIPVEVRDGSLYGRGAVDAKGPLIAGLVAAIRAADRTGLRITVIGAVQEEGPSVGARHLVGMSPPDFLIIGEPSGWDALVMGYKGSQRFTATVHRSSTHTAGREPTAAETLIELWNRIVRSCEAESREAKTEFDRLTPRLISMRSEDDGLSDVASMLVGLRLPPGVAPGRAEQIVEDLMPEATLTFRPGEQAVRGGKNNPLVARFLRAIRDEGTTPRFKVKTGTSDMNVVGPVWNCPMLAYGPGDSNLDHTPVEHVGIDEYLSAVRVLTTVLETL